MMDKERNAKKDRGLSGQTVPLSKLSESVAEDSDATTLYRKANDLKPGYMFADEAAEYLRTTWRKIALYRQLGLLKSAKFGKAFVYRKEWLDEFADEWAGYDLSNEKKVKFAINAKRWEKKHNV